MKNQDSGVQQEIYVSYSQIAVFPADMESPFNDWSPEHVAQGFAWRPESVAFATLEEAGIFRFEINVRDSFTEDVNSIRIIQVPFQLRDSTQIEIASISSGVAVPCQNGHYSLFFETGRLQDETMWGRFTLVPGLSGVFKIIKADLSLTRRSNLVITASAA